MYGPDYIVEINGGVTRGESADAAARRTGRREPRPWLAMLWRCCGAYSRIYRNRAGSAYEGQCPKCGRPVRVGISPDGTSHRFFEAG